jgi:hypothetical protein
VDVWISYINLAVGIITVVALGFVIWLVPRLTTRSRELSFGRESSLARELLFARELRSRELRSREPPAGTVTPRKTLIEIVEEKKEKFQNTTSISFHYVDEGEVRNFYNDTFREPTVESLVTEIAGEVTGEVKSGLPQLLEAKIGGKDLSKWISTVKLPDTSLPGMFAKYQREAIKRGEVTLGLEELDIELKELQQFEAAVETFDKSFGLKLDQSLIDSQVTALKQKAAETMLGRLENATGWLLIEGKFTIDLADETYRCTYRHPVTDYFSKEASPVTISFSIQKNLIQQRYAGNYTQSLGKMIPIRVYGKVWQPINRQAGAWDLAITPLAIY